MEKLIEYLSELLLLIYKAITDAILLIWPSTPDDMKLAAILDNFPSDSFAYFAIVEVFYTVAAVVALIAVYKIVKILPFT